MNKQYRVKKSTEIENIMKQGQSFGNKYFQVYKLNKEEACNFRYAISVGKKIGNAVMRNLYKRRTRAIVDSLCDKSLKMDIFVVVKPQATKITFSQMQQELNYLFKKLHI
jgi:ribonuclease P protein component